MISPLRIPALVRSSPPVVQAERSVPRILRVLGSAAVLVLMSSLLLGALPVNASQATTSSGVDLERAFEVVQAWEDDPVYVDPAVADEYPKATVDALRAKVQATEHPTHLALMGGLSYGQANDFVTLLAGAHAGHGVYIVLPEDGYLAGHVELSDPEESSAASDQLFRFLVDPDYRMSGLEWLNDVLDRLEDPQPIERRTPVAERFISSWYFHPVRNAAISAGLLIVVVAGLWYLAAKRPVKRRKYLIPAAVMQAAASSSRQRMRDVLGADALRIAQRLEELQTQGLTEAQSDIVQKGLDAFGLARRISDDESSRADDLVGSLVLFDLAERSLEAVERQRSSRLSRSFRPRGLCRVNPRHGHARKAISVEAAGHASSVELEVCGKCAADDKAKNPLQWLLVDGRPYPERSTVWARTLFGSTEADLVDEVTRTRARARR